MGSVRSDLSFSSNLMDCRLFSTTTLSPLLCPPLHLPVRGVHGTALHDGIDYDLTNCARIHCAPYANWMVMLQQQQSSITSPHIRVILRCSGIQLICSPYANNTTTQLNKSKSTLAMLLAAMRMAIQSILSMVGSRNKRAACHEGLVWR